MSDYMKRLMRLGRAAVLCGVCSLPAVSQTGAIGQELAVERHLQDGEEGRLDLSDLIQFGRNLFVANWTVQDGAGRPLTKGTGQPLSDASAPLLFPRNFNRISGPDANSCAGCHNMPFAGGSGDIVANVFVLGQRFDFATFDGRDPVPVRGALDEGGRPVTLDTIANSRATVGMFGSGLIEMLARQMTAELQAARDSLAPGAARPLIAKGISFGTLARRADGSWDVSRVEGLPPLSTATQGNLGPSLVIRPFHQAGRVISLREFTNNAFNHHHGMQAAERFGFGADPDGDGVVNELTRADITATVLFQATLPVPQQVLPQSSTAREAVSIGEQRFRAIGCASCHVPALPLDQSGWIFTEPSPYNEPGNARPGEVPAIAVDLTSDKLPGPRVQPTEDGVVWVRAFTDFKLHDICSGPGDPNSEALDMHSRPGSAEFFAGNRQFLTARLWGLANQPPYFHHGKFTTMREAVLAHAGEAQASRAAFQALSEYEQNSVIEFLKTLHIVSRPSLGT